MNQLDVKQRDQLGKKIAKKLAKADKNLLNERKQRDARIQKFADKKATMINTCK